MSQQEIVEKLREVSFLHDVEEQHLTEVAKISTERFCENAEVVFREGEPAEYVYFCVSGTISLEICAAGTGCQRVLTLGPGELIGWSALLDHSRLTSTARATRSTALIKTHARQLGALCDHNPEFGLEIMRRTSLALAKRLSAARLQLLDVFGSSGSPDIESATGGQPDAS